MRIVCTFSGGRTSSLVVARLTFFRLTAVPPLSPRTKRSAVGSQPVKSLRTPVSKDVLLLAGSRRIATPLRGEGYRLTVAIDQEQLLHYARRRIFDLIVLDAGDTTIASAIAEELRREVETPVAVLAAS